VRTRRAEPGDQDALDALWRASHPELDRPAPSLAALPGATTAVIATGRSGVNGAVVAAALVAPLHDDPAARRLTVLAASDDAWDALHAALTDRLRAEGVQRRHAVVREDAVLALGRLARAGYAVTSRSWGALLEVGDDLSAFQDAVTAATARGVALRPLVAADAEAAARLHTASRADFPSTPATEADRYGTAEMAELLAGSHAVGAWAGGELVAMTLVLVAQPGDAAETELTLTRADHRGRGLATAVKAEAVLDLVRVGVTRFATGGAQVNAAMLAVNRRLGYVLEPQWLTLTVPAS